VLITAILPDNPVSHTTIMQDWILGLIIVGSALFFLFILGIHWWMETREEERKKKKEEEKKKFFQLFRDAEAACRQNMAANVQKS
jgi:hypothetical protein